MKLLNKYIKNGVTVFRILKETEEMVLLLRCGGNNLPKWERNSTLVDFEVEEQPILPEREYTAMDYAMAQSHFNMIADVLAVIDDKKARSQMIRLYCRPRIGTGHRRILEVVFSWEITSGKEIRW